MPIKIEVRNMEWDAGEFVVDDKDLPPTSFEVMVDDEDIVGHFNGGVSSEIDQLVWKTIEGIYPFCISNCNYKFVAVGRGEA